MSIATEFKAFVMRGNVVDLAVGVIIGAAFGAIVNSLVGDVFMPLIGQITAGIDFSKAHVVLREPSADGTTPAVVLAYGKFIQATINFVIVAFVIFLIVKAVQRLHHKEAAKAEPTTQEKLLMEIRDLLRK